MSVTLKMAEHDRWVGFWPEFDFGSLGPGRRPCALTECWAGAVPGHGHGHGEVVRRVPARRPELCQRDAGLTARAAAGRRPESEQPVEAASQQVAAYATSPQAALSAPQEDTWLLTRFMALVGVQEAQGPCVSQLLQNAVSLLRLCSYSPGDINIILAHASVYYDDALAARGREMDAQEMAHVLVTLMYIAHAYVEDNTCPLNIWHQRLCKDYCSLRLLNVALVKLLKMRRWILRIGEEDLSVRCGFLEGRSTAYPQRQPLPAATPAPAPAPARRAPAAAAALPAPAPTLCAPGGVAVAAPARCPTPVSSRQRPETHRAALSTSRPAWRTPSVPRGPPQVAPSAQLACRSAGTAAPARACAGLKPWDLGLSQPWGPWPGRLAPAAPGPVLTLAVCG